MKCPNCVAEMETRHRHGVAYEHCPSCGGVWLDRGELDHLMEAVRPALTLPDPGRAAPPPKPGVGARGNAADPGSVSRKPDRKPDRKFDPAEARKRREKPRPGRAHRFGGRYSRRPRIKDILEEIFDFD